ncbi:3075_t:CDS:2, partial [Paraglomus occultum]
MAKLKIVPTLESVVDIDKLAAGEIAIQQAVLTAMNTLHENDLVHGDLHATNILWRSEGVRFVDLTGWARMEKQ